MKYKALVSSPITLLPELAKGYVSSNKE